MFLPFEKELMRLTEDGNTSQNKFWCDWPVSALREEEEEEEAVSAVGVFSDIPIRFPFPG